jgi:hypothetical protein
MAMVVSIKLLTRYNVVWLPWNDIVLKNCLCPWKYQIDPIKGKYVSMESNLITSIYLPLYYDDLYDELVQV